MIEAREIIGGYVVGSGMMFVAARTCFEPALLVAGTAGMIALPSAGEWYAGESGLGGMELRALAVLGTELALHNEWQDDGADRDSLKALVSHSVKSAGIFLIGGLVYSAGTAFSAVRANNAVRRFNEAHAMSIAPTVLRTATGQHAFGLGLSLHW
jgi:hypothetical protein